MSASLSAKAIKKQLRHASAAFDKIYEFNLKIDKNKQVLDALKSIEQAMIGHLELARMTKDDIDTFDTTGKKAYELLRFSGFSKAETVKIMTPYFKQIYRAKQKLKGKSI